MTHHTHLIADAVQPATAGFFDRALRWAQREGCEALVVELDTPGGLDTAMRTIINPKLKELMAAGADLTREYDLMKAPQAWTDGDFDLFPAGAGQGSGWYRARLRAKAW